MQRLSLRLAELGRGSSSYMTGASMEGLSKACLVSHATIHDASTMYNTKLPLRSALNIQSPAHSLHYATGKQEFSPH